MIGVVRSVWYVSDAGEVGLGRGTNKTNFAERSKHPYHVRNAKTNIVWS